MHVLGRRRLPSLFPPPLLWIESLSLEFLSLSLFSFFPSLPFELIVTSALPLSKDKVVNSIGALFPSSFLPFSFLLRFAEFLPFKGLFLKGRGGAENSGPLSPPFSLLLGKIVRN